MSTRPIPVLEAQTGTGFENLDLSGGFVSKAVNLVSGFVKKAKEAYALPEGGIKEKIIGAKEKIPEAYGAAREQVLSVIPEELPAGPAGAKFPLRKAAEFLIPGGPTKAEMEAGAPVQAVIPIGPPGMKGKFSLPKGHVEAAFEAHRTTGGSTFHPTEGDFIDKNAWAVGAHPERTQTLKGELTPESYQKFYREYAKSNQDLLARGDRAIGTYAESPTKHVFDVVKPVADTQEAMELARAAKQKSIYHLSRKELVKTLDPKDLEMAAKEKMGVETDPTKKAFIQPDGTRISVPSDEHRDIYNILSEYTKKHAEGGPTDAALHDWGDYTGGLSIGTRMKPGLGGGNEVYLRFNPDRPITPEQLQGIQETVGKIRNPNLFVEKTDGSGRVTREMVNVSDVPKILEKAGAKFEHGFDTEVRQTGTTAPGYRLWSPKEKDAALDLLHSYDRYAPEYDEAIKAGRVMGGWWERSGKSLDALFGDDAPMVKHLLASQSPQQSGITNLKMTLDSLAEWHAAGKPIEPSVVTKVLNKVPGTTESYESRFNNALRSMTGTPLLEGAGRQPAEGALISGTKVESMAQNLMGFQNRVTLDSWMGLFSPEGSQKGFQGRQVKAGAKPSQVYMSNAVVVARAAARAGIPPAQAQEQIWSFTKTLTTLAEQTRDFKTALHIMSDHDVLKQAPDFADMVLKNADIQDRLRTLGIDIQNPELHGRLEAIAAEKVEPRVGRLVAQPESDIAVLERIAERLEKARPEAKGIERKMEPGELFPEEGPKGLKTEPEGEKIQISEEGSKKPIGFPKESGQMKLFRDALLNPALPEAFRHLEPLRKAAGVSQLIDRWLGPKETGWHIGKKWFDVSTENVSKGKGYPSEMSKEVVRNIIRDKAKSLRFSEEEGKSIVKSVEAGQSFAFISSKIAKIAFGEAGPKTLAIHELTHGIADKEAAKDLFSKKRVPDEYIKEFEKLFPLHPGLPNPYELVGLGETPWLSRPHEFFTEVGTQYFLKNLPRESRLSQLWEALLRNSKDPEIRDLVGKSFIFALVLGSSLDLAKKFSLKERKSRPAPSAESEAVAGMVQ